jgi:hypothetical protein
MSVGMSHVRKPGVFAKDASHSSSRALTIPALGFLVTEDTLSGLSANHEAIRILTYPAQGPLQNPSQAFEEKIRRALLRGQIRLGPNTSPPLIQFNSGRRVYFCRAFRLDANGNPGY